MRTRVARTAPVGPCAAGDARAVADALIEHLGFEEDTVRLLAKLAPRSAHAEFPLLATTGQIVQIWGDGNVPFAWVCRPTW